MHMNDQPPVAGNARCMGIHFMELRRVKGGGQFFNKVNRVSVIILTVGKSSGSHMIIDMK